MSKRLLQTLGILVLLLALPAAAGASVAFTRLAAPYTWQSQPLNPPVYVANNDGSAARKLPVTGTDPQISPDGTMVANTPSGLATDSVAAGKWSRGLRVPMVVTRWADGTTPEATR